MARIGYLKFRVMCRLLELGDARLDECNAYAIARHFTAIDGKPTERTSVHNCLKELRNDELASSEERGGPTSDKKRCHWLTDAGIDAVRAASAEWRQMIPILDAAVEQASRDLELLDEGED